jgi:signal peptidase II
VKNIEAVLFTAWEYNLNWKKYLVDYAYLLGIAGLIIVVDQLTKGWVRSTLTIGEVYHPELWISRYVRILHWHNTGSAFGMFQGMGNIFAVLAFLVSAAILIYFPQVPRHEWLLRLAMTLQLGGAVGNLVDRLTIGHVTDFVSVGNFPVFNVADASISTGVVLLILGMWLSERRMKKEAEAAAAAETPAAETEETSTNPPLEVALPDKE